MAAEKVALHAAIKTGNLDLYKRAHEISEKQAMQIVKIAQDEDVEVNNEKNIVADELTDDEEFRGEVRELAKGENKLEMKDFDPEDSYFSEDDEEVKKDDIKAN